MTMAEEPALQAELAEVLDRWGLAGPVSVMPFTATKNANFRLRTGSGDFVARRSRTDKTAEGIVFEHALIGHMRANGVPAPELLASRSGGTWETVAGRLWTVTRFVASEPVEYAGDVLAQAGEVLGRFHAAAAGFRPPCSPPPPRDQKDPRPLLAAMAEAPMDAATRALWRDASSVTERLFREPRALRPETIIHGGCRQTSVLFRGGRLVALLDFDSARPDRRAVDIALSVVSFARSGRSATAVDPARLALLARGYRRCSPLDEATALEMAREVSVTFLYQAAASLRKLARDGEPALREKAAQRIDYAARSLGGGREIAQAWLSGGQTPQ